MRPVPLLALSGLLLGGLLLSGCAKKAGSAKNEGDRGAGGKGAGEKEKAREEERLNVATTAGDAARRDPKTNDKLYTIAWKSAAISFGSDPNGQRGIQEGTMYVVSGTVYETVDGVERPKSTFTAAKGYAKKATQTLFLEDRVVVKSPTYDATLRAKKLEWLPDVKRYKATGDVTLTTPNGTSGPMPELLATADLRRFGTPDLFEKR